MKRYFTGLVPLKEERFDRAFCGRGWKAVCSPARAEIRKCGSDTEREIVIEARSAATAQKALNLIRNAHQIPEAAPEPFGYHFKVIPADLEERKKLYPDPIFDRVGGYICTAGFPEACMLAAKASKRRAYMYAIALYHLSQSMHANDPMDLEPRMFPHEHRSPIPDDHVRFAYGIVTAYAVLEQLGLALHNEAFRHGKWIPEKRSELEERLKKAGADLTDLAVWYLRGRKTRIERSRRTQAVKKAEWAWGPVRDVEIEVVDAIADLRWMRSRVAAHDIKELAAQISVYDVANAQHLARRCILACLGFER